MIATPERIRELFTDEQLETWMEAIRIAIETKQKALATAKELNFINLDESSFGIPQLEEQMKLVQDAYEIYV